VRWTTGELDFDTWSRSPHPNTAFRQFWVPPTLFSELRWLGPDVNDPLHIMPKVEKD